jgi:uncharacterized membrane protein YgdD (TMEM256/DUF423 family)
MRAGAYLTIAAVALLLATAMGAYASHGLAGRLDAGGLRSVETAVAFHFYHGLGLLAVAVLTDGRLRTGWLDLAAALFVAGIVFFCGSIYATALGAPDWIGRLAPFGGTSFMAGWVCLAVAGFTNLRRWKHDR